MAKTKESAHDAPVYLSDTARDEWYRVIGALEESGIYQKIDLTALAAYCTHYANWRRAIEAVNNEKLTYATETGFDRPNANLKIAQDESIRMRSYMAELGLTPSSRNRIAPKKAEDGDEFDDFLKKK
jgi:P27 family predicted phage terminase small subunit